MRKKRTVQEVLSRQVAEVLPNKKGLEALMKKRKVRVYLGVDPTGSKLHLGHTIPLRKLQQFADLGHEAILVVGTGTVLAGDPSQRDKARVKITPKEIKENIATWKKQVGKVVDLKKVKVKQNGDWLLKLRAADILEIGSHLSASQLFQRGMFQERIKRGGTVWVHEMLYPLLQGYDSVALKTDVEIGGTDQVFNMLVGRELRKKMQGEEKYVLTVPMILGLDGKTMSKSSKNTVNIADEPNDMYGKLMTLHDALVSEYFELATNLSSAEIAGLKKRLSPRDLKARLAKEIVSTYHGKTKAEKAEREFSRVFQEKKAPANIPTVRARGSLSLADILVKAKLASSKSEARRLVLQGGVRVDGVVQQQENAPVRASSGTVVQVGKHRFVKIAKG